MNFDSGAQAGVVTDATLDASLLASHPESPKRVFKRWCSGVPLPVRVLPVLLTGSGILLGSAGSALCPFAVPTAVHRMKAVAPAAPVWERLITDTTPLPAGPELNEAKRGIA